MIAPSSERPDNIGGPFAWRAGRSSCSVWFYPGMCEVVADRLAAETEITDDVGHEEAALRPTIPLHPDSVSRPDNPNRPEG